MGREGGNICRALDEDEEVCRAPSSWVTAVERRVEVEEVNW